MRKQKESTLQISLPELEDKKERNIENNDTHENLDSFICDILDASPKDDLGSMEYPIYSLSSTPEAKLRRYEREGVFIQIASGSLGQATIFDKDILIYCVSQLVAASNRGRKISKEVEVTAFDLLTYTKRGTGGRSYELLSLALQRLRGTTITTNLKNFGRRRQLGFGVIEQFEIIEKSVTDDRMISIKITLSDWLFNAVQSKEILTLHPEYFQLRQGLARRLYELARKHCGKQPKWAVNLQTLREKTGSTARLFEFRRMIIALAKENPLPGYKINYDRDKDLVEFFHADQKIQLKASIQKLLT